jgi:hypothetical protein
VTAMAASTRLPSPMAVVGVVSSIIPERVLVVRISDNENGYARSTWKSAYGALKRAEESGWSRNTPRVWASTDKSDNVAFAVAGDPVFGGLLKFTFAGEAAYSQYLQMVATPGLTASVMLDRETHRFLSVKFRHGR